MEEVDEGTGVVAEALAEELVAVADAEAVEDTDMEDAELTLDILGDYCRRMKRGREEERKRDAQGVQAG